MGQLNGRIISGHSEVTTTNSSNNIGGLVDGQSEGTITGYATGAITKKQSFIGYKNVGTIQGSYFDATAGQTDTNATCVSATANIYKFTELTETSGHTVGKFYNKATGTSTTAEDSGDTEILTVQKFIDAFDLANTPNGRFPKLKTSLFGTFTQSQVITSFSARR